MTPKILLLKFIKIKTLKKGYIVCAIKSLTEHLEEASGSVESAEIHFSRFPSTLSAIILLEAIEKEEKIKELFESIMIDLSDEDEKPKKKKRKKVSWKTK